MLRRSVLAWVAVLSGGSRRDLPHADESSGGEAVSELTVGEQLRHVTEYYRGKLNVRGRFPQVALQPASGGKYAGINWYNELGERAVTLTTDGPDEELSLYVKADARGSGNTQPRKALDVHYGTADAVVEWNEFEEFVIAGETAADGTGDVYLSLQPGTDDGDAILNFLNAGGDPEWGLVGDAEGDGAFRLYNHRNGRTLLSADSETDSVNLHQSPVRGLREIAEPTPDDLATREWAWDATEDRWLYKDGGGTVHTFTPDGTL